MEKYFISRNVIFSHRNNVQHWGRRTQARVTRHTEISEGGSRPCKWGGLRETPLLYRSDQSHMLIAEQAATEFCRARRKDSRWRERKNWRKKETKRERGRGIWMTTIEIRDVRTSLSTEAYRAFEIDATDGDRLRPSGWPVISVPIIKVIFAVINSSWDLGGNAAHLRYSAVNRLFYRRLIIARGVSISAKCRPSTPALDLYAASVIALTFFLWDFRINCSCSPSTIHNCTNTRENAN